MENLNIDTSGLAPFGEAVRDILGARNFLGKICNPAAEALGEFFKEKVQKWRTTNAIKLIGGAARIYEERGLEGNTAHPRIVHQILEQGSWTDDEVLHSLWSGLLAASCSPETPDDGNIIFTSILSKLTGSQARLLAYACENTKVITTKRDFITPEHYRSLILDNIDELKTIMGIEDFQRIDRELDNLRSLELISVGIDLNGSPPHANITPQPFGLHLYAACKGYKNPTEYYKDRLPLEVAVDNTK